MTSHIPSWRGTEPAGARPKRKYIGQGEHAIDSGPETVIATLLGSCVSSCIWDPVLGIGGMNHVLFIDDSANASEIFGHGVNGMELLINGLLRQGATRNRLKSKVFGGAKMIRGLSEEGIRNGDFVINFLAREGIEHLGGDLGGTQARRIEFWPGTGRARMKYIEQDVPLKPLGRARVDNDVELF